MKNDAKDSKPARLALSKETVAALRVATSVKTGAKPLKSFPNACLSVAWCPPPPKSGNGACFP